MSNTNTSGPAFPVPGLQHDESFNGMTLRQYAAIKLRVPDSGTDWLDDMIRQGLRDEFAARAMQGFCSDPDMPLLVNTADLSWKMADIMLKAGNV